MFPDNHRQIVDARVFKVDTPEAGKPWQTVNDGVMGGRLLVANGRCDKDKGCTGSVQTAFTVIW